MEGQDCKRMREIGERGGREWRDQEMVITMMNGIVHTYLGSTDQ